MNTPLITPARIPIPDATPFASVATRFVLTDPAQRPDHTSRDNTGAAISDSRPWGLRRIRPAGPGRPIPAWTYDHARQLAVDLQGRPLVDVVASDPSASTTSSTDGEDGPSSEDWDND